MCARGRTKKMINARCVMKRKAKKREKKEEGEEKRINVYDKTNKSLTKIMKNGREWWCA